MKPTFLPLCAGVVLLLGDAQDLRAGATGQQPVNLLFLMTDQHHFQALGCAGNPVVKTPNLDRLAAGGVRFVNAFCVVPYCSPTRAALVTGRYPSSLGIGRNIAIGPNARRDPLRLREPVETYMHHLAARGYHCHQLGKWHLGDPAQLKCFPDAAEDMQAPLRLTEERVKQAGKNARDAEPRPGEVEKFSSQHTLGDVWMRRETAVAYHQYQQQVTTRKDLGVNGRATLKLPYWPETALADHCIELLKRHKDKKEPFAISWSVSPPHEPFIAPAPYYDMYNPATLPLPPTWNEHPPEFARTAAARMGQIYDAAGFREYLRCYYARVTMMDELIGRILKTLDELGLADNTLVIFTSDHGNMNGENGMMEKSTTAFYDPLMRVPLLMRLPGRIHAGTTSAAYASSVDIAPTILDYLGALSLSGAHGRSLRPLLEGKNEADCPIFGERGEPDKNNLGRVIRTPQWKLALYPRVAKERSRQLYDLQKDPGETRNLADDPAMQPVIAKLTAQLVEHMRSVRDPAVGQFTKP